MLVVTPEEYEMPDDGYDWCASCQYLAPVASTISADGIEPLQPICLECSTEMEKCFECSEVIEQCQKHPTEMEK